MLLSLLSKIYLTFFSKNATESLIDDLILAWCFKSLNNLSLFHSFFPCSSIETEAGAAEKGTEAVQLPEHIGKTVGVSGSVANALANAGHTLEAADAELVLNPLRLAIETKNLKLLESALDCLHVCSVCFIVWLLAPILIREWPFVRSCIGPRTPKFKPFSDPVICELCIICMVFTKIFFFWLPLAQKLIAYDHLEGDPGLNGGKNAPLFTDILNMVCGCVDNSSSDRYVSYIVRHLFCCICCLVFLFDFDL